MKMAQGSRASGLLVRIKHLVGLDRAIAFTVLGRFWQVAAGIVTVLLIARFLTPNEQGYYYTFYSLVALQIVFELGFSFVILQLAAHERAPLTFLPDGRVEGNAVAHARLASVLQKSIRWYSVAALLMVVTLLPAGLYFFSTHQQPGTVVLWKVPWCVVALAVAVTFQLNPVFSFLEGCGFVPQVAIMRLCQAMLGSALAWTALATHHGLFAPAMVIIGLAIVGLLFLLTGQRRRLLTNLLFHPVGEHSVGWRREIWPFQWKIAVSWICGYFIFQLFSPVLFAYQGPVAAGQMGMSLNIAGSIGTVAFAWINTKASPFGALVGRGQFRELDTLFFRTLWQSTTLLVFGAAAFLLTLLIASHSFPKIAIRVLPLWAFALLLLNTVIGHIVSSEAIYLRAHKREPFMVQAVISAILIGCSTFILGKYYGANAVVVGLIVQSVIFGLPFGTYIFITKRRKWHSPQCGAEAECMKMVAAND